MKLLSEFNYKESDTPNFYQPVTDIVVDLEKGYKGSHVFKTLKEGVIGTLEDDILTIHTVFLSDLCSPSTTIGKRRIGIYSGRAEAFGGFVHDFTRKVRRVKCSPFNRKDTDDFFWDALRLMKSKVAHTYHFAVSSVLGTLFILMTEKAIDCYCQTCKNKTNA